MERNSRVSDILLFKLIRISVGLEAEFPRISSSEEWESLYKETVSQAITGICFYGLSNLKRSWKLEGIEDNVPKSLYYEWMGTTANIQNRNEEMNERCRKLQDKLARNGMRSSILKGQGAASLYGEELALFRQSGDIDVYVDCGREKAISFAKSRGQKKINWDYKHLHLKAFKKTEVEMHYKVEVSLNLFRNKKLQLWFRSPEVQKDIFAGNYNGMVTPSIRFNSFYILLHIYRHFLYEGVGLRQLMDYYFVLKSLDDTSFAKDAILRFKMGKFASALSWVLDEVFKDERLPHIAVPDAKEGKFLLDNIMWGGNFGQYDNKLSTGKKGRLGIIIRVLEHNAHLLVHYPEEVLWAPIWIVYHLIWKLTRKRI